MNEFNKTLNLDGVIFAEKTLEKNVSFDKFFDKFIKSENKRLFNDGLILRVIGDFGFAIIFFYKENYLINKFEKDITIDVPLWAAFFDEFKKNSFDEEFIDSEVKRLIAKDEKITSMESCTSGMVATTITNTEGASAILKGAQVTYSNEAKVMAGVDKVTIDIYGVYSSQVAKAMAQTCRNTFDADIGIGVTGTTGNVDPANNDSVLGTIYYCIETNSNIAQCKLKLDTSSLKRKETKEIICGNIFRTLYFLV